MMIALQPSPDLASCLLYASQFGMSGLLDAKAEPVDTVLLDSFVQPVDRGPAAGAGAGALADGRLLGSWQYQVTGKLALAQVLAELKAVHLKSGECCCDRQTHIVLVLAPLKPVCVCALCIIIFFTCFSIFVSLCVLICCWSPLLCIFVSRHQLNERSVPRVLRDCRRPSGHQGGGPEAHLCRAAGQHLLHG